MEEVKTLNINNIEYIIVDEILIDNIKYIYLSEDNNPTNFMIRKLTMIDGKECVVNLDSVEEFDKAITVFYEKNHI